MRKLIPIGIIAFLILLSPKTKAQLAGGTYTVGINGGESYSSLTNTGGLFEAINTVGLSGNIIIQVTSDLSSESGSVGLNEWTGGFSVNIVPATSSLKTITLSSCANDLILLNGADNLTIDGRFGGTGSDRFLKLASACPLQSIVVMELDCENVTIRNCILSCDNSSTSFSTGGVIHVDKDQTNGSDNLKILYNKIQDHSGAIDLFDALQINAPDNAGATLTGLQIIGNEFLNINGKGIFTLDRDGEISGAEIMRNHFYATGSISGPGTGWAYALIQLESGSGYTIRANYFGGQDINCSGGKMNINFNSGSKTVNLIRMKIELPIATVNNIDSNVFQNISINGSTTDPLFISVIRVESGSCNIGTIDGNIIGDNTIDASIGTNASIFAQENNGSVTHNFRVLFADNVNGTINFENNTIGGIHIANNNSIGISTNLLYNRYTEANYRNNTIGGVSNNIYKRNADDFMVISSRDITENCEIIGNTCTGITANTNFNDDFYGIRVTGNATSTITNNSFQKINITSDSRFYGIRNTATDNTTITDNIINSITLNSTKSSTQFYGILVSEDNRTVTLSDNTLSNINLIENSSTSHSAELISVEGDNITYTIERNFIEKISSASTSSSTFIRGIALNSTNGLSALSLANNVILFDNNDSTNNIYQFGIYDESMAGTIKVYHNTVDIRVTKTGNRRTACYFRDNDADRDIQNNIFNNLSSGSGRHYAMYHNNTGGTMTCNYNLLYANDDPGNLVRYGGSNLTFSDWSGLGFGANSKEPIYTQTLVNFTTGKQLTQSGNDVGNSTLGITSDYAGTARPIGTGFDMGAFEIPTNTLEVPLPIKLLNFNAYQNNAFVNLKWVTATETNNDFFTIERSAEAKHWESVLTLKGASFSTKEIVYNKIDYSPLKGTSYYRLKQTDFDGKFSYSNIVPITFKSKDLKKEILVYPNPIKGNTFNLVLANKTSAEITIVVKDIKGRQVYAKKFTNANNGFINNIQLNNKITKGTYLVTVFSDNKVYHKKLTINN